MDLEEWMIKNKIKQAKLAKDIDVYPSQISSLLNGRHKPSYKLAEKIKKYTNGEVTIEELFNIERHGNIKSKVMKTIEDDSEISSLISKKVVTAIEKIMSEKNLNELIKSSIMIELEKNIKKTCISQQI